MSVKRDFERRLPAPVGPFRTLADVRIAILVVHEERPEIAAPWTYLGELALAAAEGGPIEDVVICLRIMRLHGVF